MPFSFMMPDEYLYGMGFNDYAASNDLIVVYPDFHSSWGNLEGCPDTYGYSGDNYLSRDAV